MQRISYVPHPYGVLPRGNAGNDGILSMMRSLGTLSRLLWPGREDEAHDMFLDVLTWLTPQDICRVAAANAELYTVVHSADLWRRCYQTLSPTRLQFQADWKTSVVRLWGAANGIEAAKTFVHRPMRVHRPFFHDQWFQSWICTNLPPDYQLRRCALCETDNESPARASTEMRWNYRSKFREIPRIDGARMSPSEFQEQYEQTGTPVILQNIATSWKIFHVLDGKLENVASPALFRSESLRGTLFRCEHTTMSAEDYARYAAEQRDERPIYLFDAEFGRAMSSEELFEVPPMFACDDFFSVLGAARPKYRWLIAGPARGGSSFHVDPNFTHAWNACLTGRKRWLLFPPAHPPPGVYPSDDMSDVTTPVSLTEWLLNFYSESTSKLGHVGFEGICNAGEIMYVPAGWWHFVINLESSVALTQNYVSRTNLARVITFLRAMKRSISGIDEDDDNADGRTVNLRRESMADDFVAAMRRAHPDVTEAVEKELAEASARRKRSREAKVELLSAGDEDGFSFTF